MFRPAPPSAIATSIFSKAEPWEDDKIHALNLWISQQCQNPNLLNRENVLFAYLEGLLRCQMAKPPQGVSMSKEWDGPFRAKYDRSWQGAQSQDVEPRFLWDRLRDEVDERRTTLLCLPSFIHANFNTSDINFEKWTHALIKRYEQYVHKLEMSESRLKDQMDMIGSMKSLEMAELSIQESKRVMICEFCF
jgi:hypothetical protein